MRGVSSIHPKICKQLWWKLIFACERNHANACAKSVPKAYLGVAFRLSSKRESGGECVFNFSLRVKFNFIFPIKGAYIERKGIRRISNWKRRTLKIKEWFTTVGTAPTYCKLTDQMSFRLAPNIEWIFSWRAECQLIVSNHEPISKRD